MGDTGFVEQIGGGFMQSSTLTEQGDPQDSTVGSVAQRKPDTAVRLDASYKNLERVSGWISNADNKALIVLTFQAAVVVGVATAADLLRKVATGHSTSWSLWLFYVILVALFVSLLISVFESVLAIHPDITTRDKGKGKPSLFFFGSIAAMTYEQFESQMKSLDAVGIEEELDHQTHINASIASKKFRCLQWATLSLGAELSLLAAMTLFVLITPVN